MEILADASRGIYIPQYITPLLLAAGWTHTASEEDIQAIEEGPDHEWYWEAWNTFEQSAELTDKEGRMWHLLYDGDLFAVSESTLQELLDLVKEIPKAKYVAQDQPGVLRFFNSKPKLKEGMWVSKENLSAALYIDGTGLASDWETTTIKLEN